MADVIVWSVLGLLILFGIFAFAVSKKKGKRPTDYYAFFIMGISWLPFGIVMRVVSPEAFIGNLFIILGIVYSVLGLVHRGEWKKNWRKVSRTEKVLKIWIVVGLAVLVLIGVIVLYFMSGENVSSFEECVAAGNPVMESYPRQCMSGGNVFVEDFASATAIVGVNILGQEAEDLG